MTEEQQLAKAVSLLGDALLVLDRDKVSPPLSQRIEQFLGTFSRERWGELERLAQQTELERIALAQRTPPSTA